MTSPVVLQAPAKATVLVTGGAGFFGSVVVQRLLDSGFRCVSVDLQPEWMTHPQLRSVRGDIRDRSLLEQVFAADRFDAVVHCAAVLAHASHDKRALWSSNVEGTRIVATLTADYAVPKLVFISSNCLWGRSLHRPIVEDDPPCPAEIYGRSKWEAEKILARHATHFDTVVLRAPTIIDSGRLGLLAILFDFVREGRRVWTVGSGMNRYQFVYAPDLAEACMLVLGTTGSAVYNVGSDEVKPLREVYEYVIAQAGTRARVRALPRWPAVAAMRLARALGLSPLGPYHWRMISEDFIFDTAKAKAGLGWFPTATNEQMLAEAFKSYERDFEEIQARTDVSAHRRPAEMGAIRVLKWLS